MCEKKSKEPTNEAFGKKDNKFQDAQAIRSDVDRFYRMVAAGDEAVDIPPEQIYDSLGYDPTLLAEFSPEIQQGLSCGNPLQALVYHAGETVLDLGCGAGLDLFLLRIQRPDLGILYGVDRLPEMLAKAERVRDKKGLQDIDFRQGTLTALPYPDGSIDKVISNCVINLEPDKLGAYREIFRVLKPGGQFAISDILLKQPLNEEILALPDVYGT